MSVDRVQQIVDALGSRLQRAVAVDDHMLDLVAVGADYGDADPARLWSLLHRRTRPEDVGYARLRTAVGPTWIDANDELGLAGRLCIPIRHEAVLLGLMWLIDRDRSLTPEQVQDACEASAAIAVVLHQRLTVQDRDTAFVSYLVDEVLSADPHRRGQAASDLRQYGFLEDDAHVGVLVVDGSGVGDQDTGALPGALQRVGRSFPPGRWLSAGSGRRATVLLAGPRPVHEELAAVAGRLAVHLPDAAGTWWLAIGGAAQGLAGAATSRAQAMTALSVAQRLARPAGTGPAVTSWDELGPYSLVARLPAGVLADATLPLGLFTLLRCGTAGHLVDTVERFLDCAGDKQRTARELDIHRTTLYYRLDRIEAITGLSLADGGDRLLLHLAVKLHRLDVGASGPAVAGRGPGTQHDAG